MLVLSLLFLLLALRPLPSLEQEMRFWSTLLLVLHLIHLWIPLWPVWAGFWAVVILLYRTWRGCWQAGKALLAQLALALPFLLVASMPTRFIDAGRYYDQTVRWFEHGMLAGIGNFDLYLIQASAAHSFEALGNALIGQGQNELVPLLSSYLIARWMTDANKSFSWALGLCIALVWGVLVQFAQSSSPDLLLIALVLGGFPFKNRSLRWMLMLLFPLIKLYGVLLSLFLLFQHGKDWRNGLFWSLGLAFAAFKLVYLAGWLPFIGSLSLPWSISPESGEFIGQAASAEKPMNVGTFPIANIPLRIAEYISLCIYLFLLWHIYKMRKRSIILITQALLLALWIVLFPQARLLFPLILLQLLILIRHTHPFNKARFQLKWGVLGLGLLSALSPWSKLPITYNRWQNFTRYSGWEYVQWLKPHPLWTVAVSDQGQENGWIYYSPQEDQYCFDSAFPCRRFAARSFESLDSSSLSQPRLGSWGKLPYLYNKK